MSNALVKGGVIGEWTVICPSTKPYHTLCQCSCGVIKDVNSSTLRLGKSTSCGHSLGDMHRELSYQKSDEIIGKTFGRLKVIERINVTGRATYLCDCTCGNHIIASPSQLASGHTMSCGCLRVETSKKSMAEIQHLGHKALKDSFIDGTSALTLNQKVSKNSKTGVKGVSELKSGKYRAYITVKRKQINLGVFDTLFDATQARLKAEEKYYKPILDKYDK